MDDSDESLRRRVQNERFESTGLVFPPQRARRRLKYELEPHPIGVGAAVYTAAVLEYLIAEVVDVAGKHALELGSGRIKPPHIRMARDNDKELAEVLGGLIIAHGGVAPHIHPELAHNRHRLNLGEAARIKKARNDDKRARRIRADRLVPSDSDATITSSEEDDEGSHERQERNDASKGKRKKESAPGDFGGWYLGPDRTQTTYLRENPSEIGSDEVQSESGDSMADFVVSDDQVEYAATTETDDSEGPSRGRRESRSRAREGETTSDEGHQGRRRLSRSRQRPDWRDESSEGDEDDDDDELDNNRNYSRRPERAHQSRVPSVRPRHDDSDDDLAQYGSNPPYVPCPRRGSDAAERMHSSRRDESPDNYDLDIPPLPLSRQGESRSMVDQSRFRRASESIGKTESAPNHTAKGKLRRADATTHNKHTDGSEKQDAGPKEGASEEDQSSAQRSMPSPSATTARVLQWRKQSAAVPTRIIESDEGADEAAIKAAPRSLARVTRQPAVCEEERDELTGEDESDLGGLAVHTAPRKATACHRARTDSADRRAAAPRTIKTVIATSSRRDEQKKRNGKESITPSTFQPGNRLELVSESSDSEFDGDDQDNCPPSPPSSDRQAATGRKGDALWDQPRAKPARTLREQRPSAQESTGADHTSQAGSAESQTSRPTGVLDLSGRLPPSPPQLTPPMGRTVADLRSSPLPPSPPAQRESPALPTSDRSVAERTSTHAGSAIARRGPNRVKSTVSRSTSGEAGASGKRIAVHHLQKRGMGPLRERGSKQSESSASAASPPDQQAGTSASSVGRIRKASVNESIQREQGRHGSKCVRNDGDTARPAKRTTQVNQERLTTSTSLFARRTESQEGSLVAAMQAANTSFIEGSEEEKKKEVRRRSAGNSRRAISGRTQSTSSSKRKETLILLTDEEDGPAQFAIVISDDE